MLVLIKECATALESTIFFFYQVPRGIKKKKDFISKHPVGVFQDMLPVLGSTAKVVFKQL